LYNHAIHSYQAEAPLLINVDMTRELYDTLLHQ